MRPDSGFALLAALAVTLVAGLGRAHELEPPRALHQPTAPWPPGHESPHDLVVPLRLTVAADGSVEAAIVEVSLGEPFDSIAIRTARTWRFRPAIGPNGAVRAIVRAVVRFVGEPREPGKPLVHRHAPHGAPHVHPPVDAAPDQPLEVLGHGEEQHQRTVRVEGQRRARAASEVERSRKVLSAAPHRTASDLLRTIPGVFVTQHSGEGKAHQIFFRGFDSVHGQDLEIWVAGAPVNDVSNVHGQGYADLHFLMPEVVKSLRAEPGAFSPRQGDFAVAGTLRFELGFDEPGTTASATAGSFGSRRGFLAFRPVGQPEDSFGAAEVYRTDGFGDGRAAERASAVGQVRTPLGRDSSLRLMASTYAGRFGSAGVVRQDDLENGRIDRFGSYDTNQGGHASRSQFVAELESGGDDWQLSVAPYVVRRSMELRSNFTGYLQDSVNGDATSQLNDATTLGLTASLRRRVEILSRQDSVEVGVFGRSDFIEQAYRRVNVQDGSVVATPVLADIRASGVGGYFDASVHPIERVALRGGMRADGLSFSTRNHEAVGGETRSSQGVHLGNKLTLDVALLPGLSTQVSYGEGFRSPQARSLANGQTTPFTQVSAVEAGVRYQDGKRLRAALAAFRTSLSEDVVFDETTARNEAVPSTLRIGGVADLVAEPVAWFTSALGATYTQATFQQDGGPRAVKGALVPFVPQIVVRTDVAVRGELAHVGSRLLLGKVGVGTSTLYRRPLPFGEFGDDVLLVDAQASVRLREVELKLESFNVLGAQWNDGEFVYASNFERAAAPSLLPARHVTAGAPRTVMMSLWVYL